MRIRTTLSAAALSSLILSSCNWKSTPPPTPVIDNVSIGLNEILVDDTVMVSWSANLDGCNYRYKFSDSPVSPWSQIPVLDTVLNDGSYVISVQALKDGMESDWRATPFTVSELDTPSLYIHPRFQTAATMNDTISFSIYGKGMPSFNSYSFKLKNISIISVSMAQYAGGVTLNSGGSIDYLFTPGASALSGTTPICDVKGIVVPETPAAEIEMTFESAQVDYIATVDGVQSKTKTTLENFQGGIVSFTSIPTE